MSPPGLQGRLDRRFLSFLLRHNARRSPASVLASKCWSMGTLSVLISAEMLLEFTHHWLGWIIHETLSFTARHTDPHLFPFNWSTVTPLLWFVFLVCPFGPECFPSGSFWTQVHPGSGAEPVSIPSQKISLLHKRLYHSAFLIHCSCSH